MSKDIRRVGVCEHTNKEVVQQYVDNDWLCLHNENELADEQDVYKYTKEIEMDKAKDKQVGGSHYHELGVQPWTAMEAWSTLEELRGYHKNTAIGYLAREHMKGGDEDIRKAHHHLTRLVEILDELQAEIDAEESVDLQWV